MFPAGENLQAEELRTEIQWMPPGRQQVCPTDPTTGEGVEVDIEVNESIIPALNAELAKIRQEGHEPFIDFNHNEDGGAAAHVKGFYWGGDDPQTGGIRATVEWTGKGEEALRGKAFTRFSPSFTLDNKTNQVSGLGSANAGGLVNRPAFKNNQPVTANEGDTMPLSKEEITEIVRLVAEETKPKEDSDPIKALKAENEELKKKLKQMSDDSEKQKKDAADALVQKALKAGIGNPKDEANVKSLTAMALADPSGFQLIIAANGGKASHTSRRVTPQGQDRQFEGESGDIHLDFKAKVSKYQATAGCSLREAHQAVRAANPELARAIADQSFTQVVGTE